MIREPRATGGNRRENAGARESPDHTFGFRAGADAAPLGGGCRCERSADNRRILQRGAFKVGVTGVTAAAPQDVGPGLEVRPPLEALDEVVPELKRQCDYLIVLAFVDEDRIREIADKLPEVNCILGGDVPQSSNTVQEINRAVVFNVVDKGKVIGEITLRRQGGAYQVERSRGIKIVGERLTPDPAMVALIARYKNELRQRRYELASTEGMERIPGQESTADEFVGEQNCVSCHLEAGPKTGI